LIAEIVPACVLQNFTPTVTALVAETAAQPVKNWKKRLSD
jgi:hypothetical protein